MRLTRIATLIGVGVVLLGACVPPVPIPSVPLAVSEIVVDDTASSAAFFATADMSGDARPELVVSLFNNSSGGPGEVRIYSNGASLGEWSYETVFDASAGIRFPNQVNPADVDGDGDIDLFVPGGFFICEFTLAPCGSLSWFENTGSGWDRHVIVPDGADRFYHRALLDDLDGDGIDDLITIGETSSTGRTEWYRGIVGGDRFETTPRLIGAGGGSLFILDDTDGDGDTDIVSPEFFASTRTAVWFEQVSAPDIGDPAGVWQRHTITTSAGPGFEIERLDDLYGDGETVYMATNHVNPILNGGTPSAAVYEMVPAPVVTDRWATRAVSPGFTVDSPNPGTLAPGGFGHGDVDDDGDTDLVVAGDGDDRLFVMFQEPGRTWSTYVLDTEMGQSGGAEVVDLDGDGDVEILTTSFERDMVVVYDVAP